MELRTCSKARPAANIAKELINGTFPQVESPAAIPAMFAGYRKLDNLVVIVDLNGLQIDGAISEICDPEPLDKKFEAFRFHTITIDGNDFEQIAKAFEEARATKGMPTAIIAKTVKGKGVSFMENAVNWHGVAPNDEQFEIAMRELEKAGEALCQK